MSNPRHSTSCGNRPAAALVLALALLMPAAARAVDCPTSMMALVEPQAMAQLGAALDKSSSGRRAGDPDKDPRIILSRGEDIPSIIRHNLIDPLGLPGSALAGVYFGDYGGSGTHDFLSLPDDDRALCLLVPGLELFLSDDVTHHYDSVFSVDLAGGKAELLDLWATTSFLFPGRNLAGVEAVAVERGGDRAPLLALTLPELRSVLRGMVQWYFVIDMMAAIEALYPESATTPDYLTWKYGVILGAGSIEAGIFAIADMADKTRDSTDPDLLALSRAGDDLYRGLITGFADREGGEAGFGADIPVFAARLPFTVRWQLARKLSEFGHRDLAVDFLRANVEAHPDDVDFRLALVEALLAAGDGAAARTELAAARRQWRADVKSMIVADNEDEAVAYFLPHTKDTIAFELFELRYQRMLLADARLRFLLDGDRGGFAAITAYFKDYGTDDFLAGFAEELLLTTHQIASPNDEAELVAALAVLPPGRLRELAAQAVFAHFTRDADLAATAEPAATLASAPGFAGMVCDNGAGGTALISQNDVYRKSFDAFCAPFSSGQPAEDDPATEPQQQDDGPPSP